MMDCERITEYFGLVYDGEADALVEKLVKDHLRSCSACREDYKWYGATIQGMANLEQIAPPALGKRNLDMAKLVEPDPV